MRSSNCPTDWQFYVDMVLGEVYDNDLQWVSATGKRGTLGIHSGLRMGLTGMRTQVA